MKRGGPIRRKTPLRQRGVKTLREEKAQAHFRFAVRERAEGLCEANTPACPLGPHKGAHAHHLCIADRDRGQHDPERGLLVCAVGHSWIHHNVHEAYIHGWLIRDDGGVA